MLVILAQDGTAIKPAVAKAISEGVAVIAYDRLIEDPKALYITFDNVEVGRMQARAVFAAVPAGNYVFIKGNQADANADFLRGGQQEILKAAIDSGAIKNVGESYTDNWDPAVAQTNMEQFLTANNNDVDAVVASNDGMAGGVVAALKAQGLAGKVPVSGQDGDLAALNRVALGTQIVSVWKDARELGKAAGVAAAQLCADKDISKVKSTIIFKSPGERHDVDPAHPDPGHQGQPERRHRRRVDHQGRPVQGRHRLRRRLLDASTDLGSARPASRNNRDAGRVLS